MMSVANRFTQLPMMKTVCILWVVSAALIAACDTREPQATQAADPGSEETLSSVSEEGPVTVTVTLSPKSPRLGDPLTLTLTVAAEADVIVEMPAFGEALGRFSIIDFAPRREVQEDGSLVASQRYRLEPPMSGRQRIPGLRIEYVDARSGSTSDDYQELITDELSIEVESVLPEGELVTELRPARGPLPELSRGLLSARRGVRDLSGEPIPASPDGVRPCIIA